MTDVLIVGVPRSGTTWLGEVLGSTPGSRILSEPDNHFHIAFALRAKRRLGRREHPALSPGETSAHTADFEALWRAAFAHRRGPRRADERREELSRHLVERTAPAVVSRVLAGEPPPARIRLAEALARPQTVSEPAANRVVKSVYAALCVEWIAARHPVEIVIALRHPLNVLASWLQLGWSADDAHDALATIDPEAERRLAARYDLGPPPPTHVARTARMLGLLTCELREAASRNPGWHVAIHEDLCIDPASRLRALAQDIGLGWNEDLEELVSASNRPGTGFETRRIAAELPNAWRRRLRDDQVQQALEALERLPFASDMAV